ncbi:class I adenylate-forming enzyme family protein [Amycolatopsis magusensis]|uniref:Long-chain acyl-CoA synthetase n=1 Tax=Amycolatopsis magusensis TaxID=882444 RepID=A0ABS4PMU9_9PSEU|nr:AMP-binding protein [Amycolatopsis magusensis]MBP2180737.1 long-chain acyl-CoA synthetase [Amycolatopsis magusensis]MDI5978659.1 AMP-binding protein [Amycolatopsis magusensis]
MSITSPPGLPRSLHYPEVPVGSILAGSAARYGGRTAFRQGGAQLSHEQLWRSACRFANALGAHGVGPGDVVAIHLPNCLSYPIAYYGTLLAGATCTPANPLLPPDDLAAQLSDSGAVVAVTCGAASGLLTSVLDRTEVRVVLVANPIGELPPGAVEFSAFYREANDHRPDVTFDVRETVAHLAYTGGTTGRSKGVRLPHHHVVVNTVQYSSWSHGAVPALNADGDLVLDQVGAAEEWPVRLGTGVTINLTPWFHAMGIIAALNAAVLTGYSVVLHDRLDPAAYLADAERLRVTMMGGAPALFAALLAAPDFQTRDLTSVRLVTSGAAPLPVSTLKTLRERLPHAVVAEGYGLTEVTMGAAAAPAFRSGVRKPGTVGVPLADTEVKIVAAEGGEEPLPTGSRGEVCLRGPQVMAGYHNRPEETADVLRDGWLHTGDIGTLDEDGYLSLVDRKKDLLLYKGYNVYPRELEELLAAQPAVAVAAVVGRPDEAVGELPVAFVVRAAGHADATEADLMATVNGLVLPYKRLRELHFVEKLPVSGAGKILKRKLREQL